MVYTVLPHCGLHFLEEDSLCELNSKSSCRTLNRTVSFCVRNIFTSKFQCRYILTICIRKFSSSMCFWVACDFVVF